MKKYLVLCIHNHQPVGNFPEVLEDAYQNSYRPFLEAMAKHPQVRFTIHNSGFLLDWISENHPEYIEILSRMVSAGQAEVMGGGYYEPILSVIPEADREGQVRSLSARIEELFGASPRGIWLAERVWEPNLPTLFARCGIEYLIIDDFHFRKAGLDNADLGGYYVTEDQGNAVKVFPGSERLRYLIPFRPAVEFIEHVKTLEEVYTRGDAAIYGDDGEKFGLWPGTHKWVFGDGWLEDFLASVEGAQEEGWLESTTMSDYMDGHAPLGRVYLPTSSYMEMGEWTLPAGASREFADLHKDLEAMSNGKSISRFMHGGIWRNFLAKYPESNWLHKRVLMTSRALRKAVAAGVGTAEALADARRHLYMAECNDAFWHGVFGGLYMPHLRTSLYGHLLDAENILKGLAGNQGPDTCVETSDVDADGHVETRLSTRHLNLFFKPTSGASMVEFDFRPRSVNLSNTLTRWPEAYHHKLLEKGHGTQEGEAKSIHDVVLVKEKGLEKLLVYDRVQRASFRDHFFGAGESLERFSAGTHTELGDFLDSPYAHSTDGYELRFEREGVVAGERAKVEKTVRPDGDSAFTVDYKVGGLGSESAEGMPAYFAVELNILLPCCNGPACSYMTSPKGLKGASRGLGSTGVVEGLTGVRLADTHTGVAVNILASRPVTLWRHPVYTVSLSEAGFEKIFQGSCLVFLFPVEEGRVDAMLKLAVESI